MRRPLTAPVLVALLGLLLMVAGCGDDEAADVADKEPKGQVDFKLVKLFTMTAAGGRVDPEAVPLADVVAVDEFSKQFETDSIRTTLIGLVKTTDVPDGKALYGAVVAIGCEQPPGVLVRSTDTGLTIEAKSSPGSPTPQKECFAPMTSVALVLVDEDIVG